VTKLLSRDGDMPFHYGLRVDQIRSGEIPPVLFAFPITDILRSGAIPPVQRGQLCLMSIVLAKTYFTPNLENRQTPVQYVSDSLREIITRCRAQ
jgi:hypothetical protein